MSANFVLESSEQSPGSCESGLRLEFHGSTNDIVTNNFSQVIFPEISDYFPPGKDVRVTYVVTEAMETSSRDWVGLFKVGWSSAREYSTFVWAPKFSSSEKKDKPVLVTFSAYYLPSDRNEFYQFCYVSKQGHVRGASTPFQFREPSDCDQLVEVEDETGMIVLKTKSAALKEQLDNLSKLNKCLEQRAQELAGCNRTLASELDDATLRLKATKGEMLAKDEECTKFKAELAVAMQSALDAASDLQAARNETVMLQESLEKAKVAISDLKTEKIRLTKQLTDSNVSHLSEVTSLNEQLDAEAKRSTEMESTMKALTEDLKTSKLRFENLQKDDQTRSKTFQLYSAALRQECDEAKAKSARFQEEKELFKDQLARSEEARRDIVEQLAILQESMHLKDMEIQEKMEKVLAYEEKGRMLKNELKEVSKQNHAQQSAMESQLSNMEDRLNACEASKRLISNELTEARDHRDELMSELHQIKKERDQIIRELEASRRQVNELENCLALKERAEREELWLPEKKGKLNDQNAISREHEWELLEQIEALKTKLQSAEEAVARLSSGIDSNETSTQTSVWETCGHQIGHDMKTKESIIRDLKIQIEDLHTRLSMGAAAYSEKYMECHKLEKRMKKLQNQKQLKTVVHDAQGPGHDSTTSDSQEEFTKTAQTSAAAKLLHEEVLKEDLDQLQGRQTTGRNFMSKLEQLFMAIADPDIEEQEHSSRLKVRLKEMEKSAQSQHSKYRKYKKLYQDERASHARDCEKSSVETATLKTELYGLRESKESIEHENQALKDQLREFVKNSNDENVMKTKEVLDTVIIAPASDTLMRRSSNPRQGDFSNSYPHEDLFTDQKIDLPNDLSYESNNGDEFQLANARFAALGLCPKNQKSDDSDLQGKSCSLIDVTHQIPASGVIKRQPTRSPPLIEVISGSGYDDQFACPTMSSVAKGATRQRKCTRSKKSELRSDFV